MPQMMPMNWIFYFLLFIMIFMMFIIMNYYIFYMNYKSKNLSKNNFKKLIWKW